MKRALLLLALLLPFAAIAAPAYDASSMATAGTGELNWTHTPSGTPRGAICFVVDNTATTDQISGVTYGGTAMNEVALSPITINDTEDGTVHGFFLGSSVPTGAQTVIVSVSAATTKQAACFTITASADTQIQDTSTGTGTAEPVSATVSLGGVTSFVAQGLFSGVANLANVTPNASWSSRHEHAFAAAGAMFYTYDTVSTADVTAGADFAGGDEWALLAVAISEASSSSGPLRRRRGN
jgi:hypothetical protein